jgi:5S rRNA maturation endonuclease (ribonuclease M5)
MTFKTTELKPGGAEAMMAAQGIDDKSLIERLRYKQHYTNTKWAGEAADEIERLRKIEAAVIALLDPSTRGMPLHECIDRLKEVMK